MRVLIIKTSSLGDLIHTLPALTDAQKAIPDISFDWVAEKSFAEIPFFHPAVKKVIPIELRRWRKDIIGTWKKKEWQDFYCALRKERYDKIIDGQGLMKSGFITFLSRGIKCGYDRKSIWEPLASLAYNQTFSVNPTLHAITRLRLLFSQALGYSIDASLENINYGITPNKINFSENNFTENNASISNFKQNDISDINTDNFISHVASTDNINHHEVHFNKLKFNNVNCEKSQRSKSHSSQFDFNKLNNLPYYVFLHGTSRIEKCWPENYWKILIKKLNDSHIKILLPWGNSEEKQRAENLSKDNVNTVILPKLSLTEMAKIIAHAKYVVAVDTGLGHLSAALGTPTVSLYGPTDPKEIGTIGKNQIHLTANTLTEIFPEAVLKIINK